MSSTSHLAPNKYYSWRLTTLQDNNAKVFKFKMIHLGNYCMNFLSIQDLLVIFKASGLLPLTLFSSFLLSPFVLSFYLLHYNFSIHIWEICPKRKYQIEEGEKGEREWWRKIKSLLPPYITVPVWLNTTRHWSRAGTVCKRWKVRRSH